MARECVVVPLLFEAARWARWDPLGLLTLFLKEEKKKRRSVFPLDMDAINIAFCTAFVFAVVVATGAVGMSVCLCVCVARVWISAWTRWPVWDQ